VSASAPEQDDVGALVETLSASLAQVEEIAKRPRVTPHLKLLIQDANTASLTAKRLARALKGRTPAPSENEVRPEGPRLADVQMFLGMLAGEICPVCGSSALAQGADKTS